MSRFHRLELGGSAGRTPAPRQPSAEPLPPSLRPDPLTDADQHRRAGRFEEALRCYSRALESDRSLIVGWVGQVQMLIELNEYPEAELWSRKALELFRDNAELMAGRAHALCRMGDLRQAQPLSDAAINQRDQSAYRWIVRGEILLARRDDKAQHCFDKAALIDRDWLVPLEIARIYIHHGHFAKALTHARSAVATAPAEPYGWFLQGCIQTELGLINLAEQSLRRCLELAPKHQEARDRLHDLADRSRWFARFRAWLKGR